MIKDINKFTPKITKIAMDAFANQNNLRSNKSDPLSNPPKSYSNEIYSTLKVI